MYSPALLCPDLSPTAVGGAANVSFKRLKSTNLFLTELPLFHPYLFYSWNFLYASWWIVKNNW